MHFSHSFGTYAYGKTRRSVMSQRKMKTRKSRKPKHAPSLAEDLGALLSVVEGELRGLILLTLLTGHPPRQTVGLKWKDVVPLVEQLSFYFSTTNQSRQPDALLFPGLAKLPPHLLDGSTKPRGNRRQSLTALRHLFTQTFEAEGVIKPE
jgi:hypothetical protein